MNNAEFMIADRKIGLNHRPLIIAEISGNHNQSLTRALNLVAHAAKAGAEVIKLQTYTADTLTLDVNNEDFFINDEDSLWEGSSLYSLYEKAYTPWEWHEEIMNKAKEYGMICFSSPFDETAVDFLEDLDVPAYKIASFENNHIPLIKKVASTGKPLIISTGMANLSEIEYALKSASDAGCKNLALLKCTSTYPASAQNTNLNTIPHMREMFDCEVGLSDHTLGIGTSIAAIANGASIIEKHFTLSRDDGGVDSQFSLEPNELSQLIVESERAWASMGGVQYGPTDEEKKSISFRRSLYIAEDINAGDILTEKNLRCIRPGYGLSPRYYNLLIGKKVTKSIKKGTAFSWEFVL